MYEYRKLRGKIVEVYGNQEEFAKKIGISTVSVSKKLNGGSGFNQKSMKRWGDALNIPVSEYGLYFFN